MPEATEANPLRAAISKAYEAAEQGAETAPAAPPPESSFRVTDGEEGGPIPSAPDAKAEAPAQAEGARARDDKGRFTPKAPATEAAKPAGAPEAEATSPSASASGAAPAKEAPKEADAPDTAKAPASLTPLSRELWSKVPPEVQKDFVRRERETDALLQSTKEAREGFRAFREVVAPFEGLIRAQGGEPLAAVQNLLQTAAILHTAPQAQRVALFQRMAQQFGVPLEALGGSAAPEGAVPQAPPPVPHVDTQAIVAAARREALEAVRAQEARRELQAFQAAAPEFFEDVREDMADLIDASERRGRPMGLKEAYERSLLLHPDIQQVLRQREDAKRAEASVAQAQASRAASSSVKPQPLGGMRTEAPKGLRNALEAAWETHSRR